MAEAALYGCTLDLEFPYELIVAKHVAWIPEFDTA